MKKILIILFLLLFLSGCSQPIVVDANLSNTVKEMLDNNQSICFEDVVDDFDSVLIENCYSIKKTLADNAIKGHYQEYYNDEILIVFIRDNWIIKIIQCKDLMQYQYLFTKKIYPSDYVFEMNE